MKKFTIPSLLLVSALFFMSCGKDSFTSDVDKAVEIQCKLKKMRSAKSANTIDRNKLQNELIVIDKEMKSKYKESADFSKYRQEVARKLKECN